MLELGLVIMNLELHTLWISDVSYKNFTYFAYKIIISYIIKLTYSYIIHYIYIYIYINK